MITEASEKKDLVNAIGEEVSLLRALMSSLEQNQVNSVPYEDSWTAGQLTRHVVKSISGLARAMTMEAKPTERNAGERIPELKKTFLDFSVKMKSPDFIVPEPGPYNKQAIIEELNGSFELLKENTNNADLTGQLDKLLLGPITKLELLHFVLYHTQRHLHQLKKICGALKNEYSPGNVPG